MIRFVKPIYFFSIVLFRKAIPIMTFTVMFIILATVFDKWSYDRRPATDFINYYSFNVNNARVGEDVYFQVCRVHDKNYSYNGNLSIFVYKNADPNSEPLKVYSRELAGILRDGNCENKVLRASDFRHDSGTYKMAFCIDFKVKYDISKQACKDSNIYKIYPVATDVNAQIEYYQGQIKILQDQLNGIGVGQSTDPSDLRADGQTPQNTNPPGNPQTTSPPTSNSQNNSGQNPPDVPPPASQPECRVGLFGLCLLH